MAFQPRVGHRLMSSAAVEGSGRTVGQLGQGESEVSVPMGRMPLEIQIYLLMERRQDIGVLLEIPSVQV